MHDLLMSNMESDQWPEDAERMYDRVDVLGRGSYGLVWMARRNNPDAKQEEFVAIKNIRIKEAKSRIYARREISILSELHHPNIIRLIHEFPIYESSKLVVLQLARGPDLQALVNHRGALGVSLSRLISRHLIAAISYMHGRAVLHRDIKPTNCILENTQGNAQDVYDWANDDAIWSDGEKAERAVASNKWRIMLIDFGFARALTRQEIDGQKTPMRQSILKEIEKSVSNVSTLVKNDLQDDTLCKRNKDSLRRASFFHERVEHPEITSSKRRMTGVSSGFSKKELDTLEEAESEEEKTVDTSHSDRKPRSFARRQAKRQSSARTKLRSMSALGTKAFAAPEIKHDLRNKTQEDIDYKHQALTHCVADYGMIVDSYSVGWTIRVIMTGVPPNSTISEYLELNTSLAEDIGCFCCQSKQSDAPQLKLRDVDELPRIAVHLILQLTMMKPEDRMTVREAQNHPWIRGRDDEEPYELPEGDIPSLHGDPVVPLECAGSFPGGSLS